jgi:hypothetical protein
LAFDSYCETECTHVDTIMGMLEEGDDRVPARMCAYTAAIALNAIADNIVTKNELRDRNPQSFQKRSKFRQNVAEYVSALTQNADACANEMHAASAEGLTLDRVRTVTEVDLIAILIRNRPPGYNLPEYSS